MLGKELGTRTFLCWPNPLESARFCNPKTRPSRLALSKEREWGEGELLPARLTVNRTSQSSCKTTKASRAREYHKAAAIPLHDRNGLVHQSKLQGLRGRSSSGPFIKRAWKVVITIHKSLGEDTEAYKDPRADERTSRDSNPASVTPRTVRCPEWGKKSHPGSPAENTSSSQASGHRLHRGALSQAPQSSLTVKTQEKWERLP